MSPLARSPLRCVGPRSAAPACGRRAHDRRRQGLPSAIQWSWPACPRDVPCTSTTLRRGAVRSPGRLNTDRKAVQHVAPKRRAASSRDRSTTWMRLDAGSRSNEPAHRKASSAVGAVGEAVCVPRASRATTVDLRAPAGRALRRSVALEPPRNASSLGARGGRPPRTAPVAQAALDDLGPPATRRTSGANAPRDDPVDARPRPAASRSCTTASRCTTSPSDDSLTISTRKVRARARTRRASVLRGELRVRLDRAQRSHEVGLDAVQRRWGWPLENASPGRGSCSTRARGRSRPRTGAQPVDRDQPARVGEVSLPGAGAPMTRRGSPRARHVQPGVEWPVGEGVAHRARAEAARQDLGRRAAVYKMSKPYQRSAKKMWFILPASGRRSRAVWSDESEARYHITGTPLPSSRTCRREALRAFDVEDDLPA